MAARLSELLSSMLDRSLVQPGSFFAPNYDLDWAPVGGPDTAVSYGHNTEAAWLMAESVDALEASGGLSAGEAAGMRQQLVGVGEAAVAAGYDSQYGGFYDSGPPLQAAGNATGPGGGYGGNAAINREKVWWTQAEGLLGLQWLAAQTGQRRYLDLLEQTLGFIDAHLWDKTYGEWYWGVTEAGQLPANFTSGGTSYPGDAKATAWKASYHTGRALLLLRQRLRAAAAAAAGGPSNSTAGPA